MACLILLSSHIYLPVTLGDCSLITYFRAIAKLYYILYLTFLLFLHSTYHQPKLLCFTYCSFVHYVFLCLVCKCYEGKNVYIFTQPIHLIVFGCCISRAILHMSIHPSKLGSSWQTKVWISPKSLCENHWVLLGLLIGLWVRGCLQEQKCLKYSCITKTHPSTSDSSQKLGIWSTLYTLQAT